MTTSSQTSSNGTDPDWDIVIVGMGPVGVTLAGLMGRFGHRVLAIDKEADVYDQPRAIGMDHETLRVFQQLGITKDLEPFVSDYKTTEYRSASGEVIRRFISQEPPFTLGWPPYQTFVQPDLERVLRAHVHEIDGVTFKTSHTLTDMDTSGPLTTLDIHDTANNTKSQLTARYVIGCDGGSSFVRKHLAIPFEDLIFDEAWLVVDVLVGDGVDLPDMNIQYCDPARPHTFVVGPKNLRRWEFRIMHGEQPEDMTKDATVWKLLEPWLTPDQATIWRATTYRFHALVAQAWRAGNTFLAGDACHMTPPFLAQGMVQGIKDATNLAWKLDAVLRGAAPALLDSYEAERRPLVRDVIGITKDLGRIIGETDPEAAEARNNRMRHDMAEGRGETVRADLFPALAVGELNDEGAPQKLGVGKPAPQPRVKRGDEWVLLDDILGHSFSVLAVPQVEIRDPTGELAVQHGISVQVIGRTPNSALQEQDEVFVAWMKAHNAVAIVTRPDHIVFAIVEDPKELEEAVKMAVNVKAGTRAER